MNPNKPFKIKDRDPDDTNGFKDENQAKAELSENVKELAKLQSQLYAENKRSVLLVLQGMDTSGKDGTVKHVMSGLNPMGVRISAFGKPTPKELDHDFLWRIHAQCPARGEIGVFNRSHYEDVLIVRVLKLIDDQAAQARFKHINQFEKMLTDNGTIVIKCFLHISKDEQKQRLEERLSDPTKNWKFQVSDLDTRAQWDTYMKMYEQAISETSTEHAPWYVVPANRKWFRNLLISELLVETLNDLKPQLAYPNPLVELRSVRVV